MIRRSLAQKAGMDRSPRSPISTLSPSEPLSLDEIYKRTFPTVWRVLSVMVIPRLEDREDIAHEVFITVFRKLPTYDGHTAIDAWVTGFTWRVALGYLRLSRHHRELPIKAIELEAMAVDTAPSAEERMIAAERRLLVQRILASIREERRIVLIMKDLRGFAMADIVRVLGILPSTAWTRLRLARDDFSRAAKRLNRDERDLLGVPGLLAASSLPFDVEALLLREREAPVDDIPAELRDRVWSRVRGRVGDMVVRGEVVAHVAGTMRPGAAPMSRLSLHPSGGLTASAFAVGVLAGALIPSSPRAVEPMREPTVAAIERGTITELREDRTAPRRADLAPPPPAAKPIRAAARAVAVQPVPAEKKVAMEGAGDGHPDIVEDALVQRVGSSLREGKPAEAMAIMEDLQRRYPEGRLGQEREALIVQMLAAMGRREEASARLARFRELYPKSLLLPMLEQAVRDGARVSISR